jgi:hypothetical protein
MAKVNYKLTSKQSIKKFVSHIRDHCSEYGVTVTFTSGKKLNADDGERCFGYFWEPWRKRTKGSGYKFRDGEIKVAKGSGETIWVHTLAHEYAHFLQWLKRRKFWLNASEYQHEKAAEYTAIRLIKKHNVEVDLRTIKASSRKYMNQYYGEHQHKKMVKN